MRTQDAQTIHWRTPLPLRRPAVQYAFAVALVLAATLLRIPLEPWLIGRAPYGLYFPALAVVAWTCDVRPTVFTALLALASAWYFFVPPENSFFPKQEGHAASLLVYGATAASLIWLSRAASAARRELIAGFASRAQLAAIVESSDDAIVSKDLNGFIQSWNAGAERLFGYTAGEAVGRHITLLIPEERRFEEERILAALRRGDRVDHFETVRVAKDGRRLEISLSVSPVRDADGKIVGASKVARDVTERRRAERALAQQREWFRVTLASIGDAVITTDRAGAVTYMNPVAERLTGFALAEAEGRPLAEVFRVVNERTRAPVENPCERVLRSGGVVGLANHSALIARDGAEHPIEDSAAPIVDDERNMIGVVLVFHDVTQRRRAEQAVAEQREWLETTLVSIGDAVIATDVRGCVTFMNPVAERLTGWRSVEAEGRACAEVFRIVNESTREEVESPIARVLREGVVVGLANHTVLIARDGSERPIDDSAAPIRGTDGAIAGVVLVFHDVSARRDAERERQALDRERERLLESERAARSEAERANRLKDDFVATISHELRTPLNAILGWTQILTSQSHDAPTLTRGLAVIERNTRLQAELISDLLDVSRIVSGKLRLELLLVDVATMVEQALDTIRPAADEKGVEIRCEVDRAIGPIAGDSARLQQVVWNLLSNAVKFTPAGGHIDLRVTREPAYARIVVSDTGVGIPADFLPYLFDRFRQADPSTTRRFGGLGLGLTIVKQLVDLHGGTIDGYSEGEGKGATFVVRLPLHAQLTAQPPEPGAAPPWTPPALARLDGVYVLVVEDEPDARELVDRVLAEAGCRVLSVASAEEALAALELERPHLVVSDIGLPDQDGYTLIQRVRALEHGDTRTLPAIALTAFARIEDRTRALRAGYQAHIAKPVDPAELLATVASFAQIAGRDRNPD
jgi:PAS domain S-box-containing protein